MRGATQRGGLDARVSELAGVTYQPGFDRGRIGLDVKLQAERVLADAERLIVEGFFDPIMQRIPFEGVRERFNTAILEKMV